MRFRTNRIIEKNEQGKKGVGLGLVYPSAEAIEIVGMLGGFDFVQLDGEHGAVLAGVDRRDVPDRRWLRAQCDRTGARYR